MYTVPEIHSGTRRITFVDRISGIRFSRDDVEDPHAPIIPHPIPFTKPFLRARHSDRYRLDYPPREFYHHSTTSFFGITLWQTIPYPTDLGLETRPPDINAMTADALR